MEIIQPFATLDDFVWRKQDNTEVAIVVRVGAPFPKSGGEWACPIQLVGLDDQVREICGEGSMQALCLALSFVRTRLIDLIERGAHVAWVDEPDERIEVDYVRTIFGVSL